MSRRVHLPALVSLLALVACGTHHPDLDLDTDSPDGVTTPDGGEGLTVDPADGSALPDGGEGVTVDPATGEVVAHAANPAGGEAGEHGERFNWDEAAASLDLDAELRGGKVAEGKAGPWTTRTSGGGAGYGAALDGSAVAGPGGSAMRRGGRGGLLAKRAPAKDRVSSAPAPELEALGYADADMPVMDVSEEEMPVLRDGRRTAQAPGLKAGSTDDNADIAAYTAFISEFTAPGRIHGAVDTLDISDARELVVSDPLGRPVPGAQVSVTDLATDRLVWTGTTYGDGTAPWYPHLRAGLLGEADVDGSLGYAVQAHHDGVFTTQIVGAQSDTVRLTLDESSTGPTKLDVVFLIDTTGSMGDEIERIKSTLLSTTAKVRGLDRNVDLQYGAVLYRDIGDEYVTKSHPLTGNIQGFDTALQTIRASGGGDGPESLNQGMAVAVDTMDWREDSAKLVFVVADAPPHMDYQGDVSYGRSALAALHKGIRIHTVAASGLDDHGSLVFRQTAQLSQGKFIFIEYGSTAASAADHGVRGPVASNNLDDILYKEIKSEVVGWGDGGGLARRFRR
jgi:hypothetical protein